MRRPVVAVGGRLRESRAGDRLLFGAAVDNGVDDVQVGGSLNAIDLKLGGQSLDSRYAIAGIASKKYFVMPPATGDFVDNAITTASTTTVPLNLGFIEAYPFIPDRTVTIDQIGVSITTAVASSTLVCGMMSSKTSDSSPDVLLRSSGELNAAAVAYVSGSITPLELTTGTLYWLVINPSASGINVRAITTGNSLGVGTMAAGNSTTYFNKIRQGYTYDGSLLTSWGTFINAQRLNSHIPSIRMRVV